MYIRRCTVLKKGRIAWDEYAFSDMLSCDTRLFDVCCEFADLVAKFTMFSLNLWYNKSGM